jgi:hypothetical protein
MFDIRTHCWVHDLIIFTDNPTRIAFVATLSVAGSQGRTVSWRCGGDVAAAIAHRDAAGPSVTLGRPDRAADHPVACVPWARKTGRTALRGSPWPAFRPVTTAGGLPDDVV